jgi:hypothetical protein
MHTGKLVGMRIRFVFDFGKSSRPLNDTIFLTTHYQNIGFELDDGCQNPDNKRR